MFKWLNSIDKITLGWLKPHTKLNCDDLMFLNKNINGEIKSLHL